uniref:SWIM-type domain-containing protein n=1 Tax=Lactuca sativa TaxID=4236 RepID=A0A9R1UI15_LACSA|nr:hypothetical protein LSAT_V11C900501990 [Lactuca sativa]
MIIHAKKRPLLTMLEMVRLSVTRRVSIMHNVHESWDSLIFPTIIKKLETFGDHYRLWSVISSGGGVFETRSTYEYYCVDILWELLGISCVHAIASMFNQQKPEDFINSWFSIERFESSYDIFYNL